MNISKIFKQLLGKREQTTGSGGRIIFDPQAKSTGSCTRCRKRIEPIRHPETGEFRYWRGDTSLKVCDGQICVSCQMRLCFFCQMSENCPKCGKAMNLIISGF
jgi:hypothetical protein